MRAWSMSAGVLRRVIPILALGLAAHGLGASESDPLFESLDVLEVRIEGPLRDIRRDRDSDPDDRPAVFAYRSADGDWRRFDIGLRPRGKSRRDSDVCRFPPLRLDFKRKDVRGTQFDGQNKLKMVTHCRRSDRHDRYVYKEYLVYRMLNVVSDAGFRVRPLDVVYLDVERPDREIRRFGFFIERIDRLARRLGLEIAEPDRIAPQTLEPQHTSRMALFQLMIGNTDFSFIAAPPDDHCCHNVKLLRDADGMYWPMPYDFDISGFVDPPYAIVDYQLPINDVRDRLYRGFCWSDGALEAAVAHFNAVRGELMAVLREETPLHDRRRERAIDYIDDFYELLNDPREFDREVLDECRGAPLPGVVDQDSG